MRVLVINSGSSSIKYKLFEMADESVVVQGAVTNIGGAGTSAGAQARDHDEGLAAAFAAIAAALGQSGSDVDAIGHRVVLGGPHYSAPVLVDDEVCAAIAEHAMLVPLHNPPNLKGIEAARRLRPGLPQVAVFDTAFHRTIPEVAALYPLSQTLADRHGIRRYGFHGTSCAWSLGAAADFLGRRREKLNLIIAHLGAGASITAVRDGRSVDTSMGMSPLEGVMMQTRPGDLDPGILLHLLRSGMRAEALDQLLNHESGVKGVAGDGDMLSVARRAEAGDESAARAREMYAYRAAGYVAAYAGLVWPLDALVFTGGIGENDGWMRDRICSWLPHLPLRLDPEANAEGLTVPVRSLRQGEGGPDILLVAANEELEIARETIAALRSEGSR